MFKILEKLTAKNKKQDDIRMPSHLSAAEQKQVQTVIDRARGDSTVPHSAQDSIPFQRMFPDGICRVTDNYYTKTIQFQDINYQLAQQEDQTAIFEEWCSFLNFFDSSIRFELSFMNMATDAANFEKMVRIPYQKDHFNPVRTEYSTMLRRQLAQGNNGLTKTKYLTFGIEAESMKQAKPRLIHIEIDLMNNFKRLGVRAKLLNGKERLHLMHDMFHMGDHDRFNFDWKEGLQPVEKTVIDRCVHQIYQTYFENPVPENMPVLQDLYEALLRQDEKEAHHVATALEIYVTGSLNLFNHRTNVDINNRLVCYDIKELGKQLKKIGMLVVQDQVWGRVTANRNAGKATRYYMDEFHLLLKEEQTAAYSVEIWKRFRKWGGIPTGITQNVKVRPDRALCKAV